MKTALQLYCPIWNSREESERANGMEKKKPTDDENDMVHFLGAAPFQEGDKAVIFHWIGAF